MADDMLTRARQKREWLLAEVARIDNFLAVAEELAREDSRKDRAQTAPRQTVRRGAGADTVAAALDIVLDTGPQHTRDLLPLIIARGIDVGGKSPIATLSARLSSSGKGIIEMMNGRWQAVARNEAPEPEVAPEREESANSPVKDMSADSSFHHQTKGDSYATALA